MYGVIRLVMLIVSKTFDIIMSCSKVVKTESATTVV